MTQITPKVETEESNYMRQQTHQAQAGDKARLAIRKASIARGNEKTSIPMNDGERRLKSDRELAITEAYQPPVRKEFPDSPGNILTQSINSPSRDDEENAVERKRSHLFIRQTADHIRTIRRQSQDASLVNVQGDLSLNNMARNDVLSNTATTTVLQTVKDMQPVAGNSDPVSRVVAMSHRRTSQSSTTTKDDEQEASQQASYDSDYFIEEDTSEERERAVMLPLSDGHQFLGLSWLDKAVDDIADEVQFHRPPSHPRTWPRSIPREWSLDPGDILIAIAVRRRCEERDMRGILTMTKIATGSDHNYDYLCAWCLGEAARCSFLEALPVFYSVFKPPHGRQWVLEWAMRKAIGDSEEQLATMRWLRRRGVYVGIVEVTIASRGGHEKALQLLMEWGADPTQEVDLFGVDSRPLREAAKAGHIGIVNILLGAGVRAADPDAVGNAARFGQLDILRALVAAGASVFGPGSCGQDGDPFCLAAAGGQLEVMRYILRLGASLDERLYRVDLVRGDEALSQAARAGWPSCEGICLMLLDSGVTPVFTESDDRSPPNSTAHIAYSFACMGGHISLLTRILEAGADPNAIAGWLYNSELLSRAGNGMEEEDCSYGSMLSLACGAGRFEAARLLLQYGADVHYRGHVYYEAQPPLHIAAKYGRIDIIDLLLAHGANIHAHASPVVKGTPIHIAAAAGATISVGRLLERAGEELLEVQDDKGQTPLIVAARQGKLEVVKLLLDKGASVTARDGEGWTAAHRAAWNGHEQTIRLLVDRGAHPEAETPSGLTIAELLGHAEREAGLTALEGHRG
ncbi:Pfs, NACHT and Ankyrin domain protein [Aspergillus terreus]|uniref:Pfs, NACHT and Ankyrin domain protein n=1 Tax=Aspergillus terreus TaxID=33178 RepID=A0A5M3YSV1_ASPTE|nr:hypothetical protein ATETN484_0003080900 [Aspergillus terreus]GFF14795.1 Pfs, NACHT and Ankyrin domain protein [Aspergillus terreus]